ncbi:putative membrane protein [Candidatus Haloredivivus sp. G17]|nr:putative membrane protein [Candidatus Haloredivivus sp. G17]
MFDYGSVNLYISKLVALEAAIATVFFINDHFAFSEFGKKAFAILRTNLVRAGGTLISFSGLYIGVELGLHYMIANTIGVGLGSMFNYYFERFEDLELYLSPLNLQPGSLHLPCLSLIDPVKPRELIQQICHRCYQG